MQDIKWECTLDGAEYKEYEVFLGDQPLGLVSWDGDSASQGEIPAGLRERDASAGCWYTTASDGQPRYFQTQEAVIDFLKESQLETTKLSTQLRVEAQKLTNFAEVAESVELKAHDQ